ncbi:unnamed protein product [Ciceribacter sp. T2.26MG-112.2]|nr:unnamed protein product [Ciceribacter naphthalenivorans]
MRNGRACKARPSNRSSESIAVTNARSLRRRAGIRFCIFPFGVAGKTIQRIVFSNERPEPKATGRGTVRRI